AFGLVDADLADIGAGRPVVEAEGAIAAQGPERHVGRPGAIALRTAEGPALEARSVRGEERRPVLEVREPRAAQGQPRRMERGCDHFFSPQPPRPESPAGRFRPPRPPRPSAAGRPPGILPPPMPSCTPLAIASSSSGLIFEGSGIPPLPNMPF